MNTTPGNVENRPETAGTAPSHPAATSSGSAGPGDSASTSGGGGGGGGLTHVNAKGQATMVDVGHKPPMHRKATAEGFFVAAPETLDRLMGEAGAATLPKGEALGVARLAGIQAAKRTDEWIPLCHSLPMDAVHVDFQRVDPSRVRVTATASVTAKTGVEMEALVAVSAACLTLYDMTKAVDKDLKIEGVRLVEKTKTSVKCDL